MRRGRLTHAVASVAALVASGFVAAPTAPSTAIELFPLAVQAPDSALVTNASAASSLACTLPKAAATDPPAVGYAWYHCYTPQQMRTAYQVDQARDPGGAPLDGAGQTIVLVDSYGSPTAAHDLQFFHDTFFPDLPDPQFDEVYSLGKPDYSNANADSQGLSGPSAAAGWSGEATLDIEWAYAIAPRAHIVLLAVPPAETLGVQGFPNLFKAIDEAIDTYPAGTVFSMSFGIAELTFGGAAQQQAARFDQVLAEGSAKGDSFFSSAGDGGTTRQSKQDKETRSYDIPTVGWPTSSPELTSVGGTQLQAGWTWDPTSDVSFTATATQAGPNPDYFHSTPGGLTEAVWNESWLPTATGGGPSVIYPRPAWQDPVAARITDADGQQVDARGTPDLSWNAAVNGGALVYNTAFPNARRSGWGLVGGTSASSPQVAALVALANEYQHAVDRPYLGNIAPLLYRMSDTQRTAAFRDIVPITEGTASVGVLQNNQEWDWNGYNQPDTPGPILGHSTATGWDETTGFGSPVAPGFITSLSAVRGGS